MDELPWSPVLLEIHKSVPWPPTEASEAPQRDTPDELVEGVRSVWDRYSGRCSTCLRLLGLLHAPLSQDLMSIELGTVSHVISGDCRAHHTFFLRLVGFDWHSETNDERAVSILRKHRYSGLEVLIQGSIYPPIELVKDPDILHHPGYGRILDPTLIEPQLLKAWSERCTNIHGTGCRASLSHYLVESTGPANLIDIQRNCIVTASSRMRYVALSYVWGKNTWLTTTTTNLQRLSCFTALLNEPDIPNTILDAMRVVRLLGERYLWVDSLCIVQDDEETKVAQLNNMYAIYAGACVTIVAAQGSDASHGLRRLAGSTSSGELVQQFFQVRDSENVVERIFDPEPDYGQQNTWHTRAWTFQELLFSTRFLIFDKDSVRWDCPSSAWFEDVECQEVRGDSTFRRWQKSIAAGVPDFWAYGDMVSHFNRRMLTYPEDALFAIAGITSLLSRTFRDGFLCGLPELFFHIALLWQPLTVVRRRQPSPRSTSSGITVYLPSWSWAGWQGELDPWVWNSGKDYSKGHGQGCCTSRETFRLLQWRSSDEPNYEGSRCIKSDFSAYKSCTNTIQQLPLGWTRHIYDESENGLNPYLGPLQGRRYFYTHNSDANIETWYPLPPYEPGSQPIIRL
ncbi:heterokaryon incompatibility protein-domain-containing protein [Ilyonectria sp. MPI-CAGE-AT-0026]|nr:heterokaryon incompatibility protein-domain-containing protein [Ilyonectria sp. MPI-CAGE-AT-0026]